MPKKKSLREALEILADQDPLISLRQRNDEGGISVHLYGEVQKEVLSDTLAVEFGVQIRQVPAISGGIVSDPPSTT